MNLELRTTSVQHLCAELPYDWHVPMRMKMSSGCSVLTWLHGETFGQASTLRALDSAACRACPDIMEIETYDTQIHIVIFMFG